MREMGGEQIALCERKRHVAAALESGINARLAHSLALNRFQLAVPAAPKATDPVAVFEVQRPDVDGVVILCTL